MPFELTEVQKVSVTNANPRTEFHGEDHVRAIDITFAITGENTLLDLIEPGLREHHYTNRALTAGQEALPDIVIPLPNLRHPHLPTSYQYAKGVKWRGFRFIRDFGIREDQIDFSDCAAGGLKYEIQEGGTVSIWCTVSYNGEELADNELYGMLSGLASEGEMHIKLLAPPELAVAKKGFRAGKPDTPPTSKGDADQGELGDGEEGDGDELDPDSPEGALADTEKA